MSEWAEKTGLPHPNLVLIIFLSSAIIGGIADGWTAAQGILTILIGSVLILLVEAVAYLRANREGET